jgi:UDP-MurNAc hydroxylase
VRLTWVNHASFLLESGDVRLLCDPWIEGTVFNNGWRLTSPTRMSYDDFSRVTHIWFSHEHPDHFSPPNLKKIPAEIRRRILVLFHETRDKRVVNACKALGFPVQELPERKAFSISENFRVLCGLNDLIDSWIAIFAAGKTVLNLNDCLFPKQGDLDNVHSLVGGVDVLLSQFSYANWVGNPDDFAAQKAQADRKRAEMTKQIRAIQPRQFIPFASFIHFCHKENVFMNRSVNRIGDIHRFLTQELHQESIVLYPGDEWEVGTQNDSREAIEKYEADFQQAQNSPPMTSQSVALADLQKAMAGLIGKCRAKNSPFVLKAMAPAVVRLSDLQQEVEISFRRGILPVEGKRPDLILSSNSLLYCIETDWGGETLKINGRFQIPRGGNAGRFFRLFRVPQYNSYGSTVDLKFVTGRLIDVVRRHAQP